MMDKLASFAREILLTARKEANLHVLFSVLCCMRQLYELDLHDNVMELVHGLASAELLKTVHSVATIDLSRLGGDMGKIEQFYIRHDTTTTTTATILMIIKEKKQKYNRNYFPLRLYIVKGGPR
jgi:hypothetical protein